MVANMGPLVRWLEDRLWMHVTDSASITPAEARGLSATKQAALHPLEPRHLK